MGNKKPRRFWRRGFCPSGIARLAGETDAQGAKGEKLLLAAGRGRRGSAAFAAAGTTRTALTAAGATLAELGPLLLLLRRENGLDLGGVFLADSLHGLADLRAVGFLAELLALGRDLLALGGEDGLQLLDLLVAEAELLLEHLDIQAAAALAALLTGLFTLALALILGLGGHRGEETAGKGEAPDNGLHLGLHGWDLDSVFG